VSLGGTSPHQQRRPLRTKMLRTATHTGGFDVSENQAKGSSEDEPADCAANDVTSQGLSGASRYSGEVPHGCNKSYSPVAYLLTRTVEVATDHG